MPTSTYLGLSYPSLSDAPNIPSWLQTLATGIDGKLGGVVICTSGTRPTARVGATIYETDTNRYVIYSGSAWVTVGQTITGSFTPTPTASPTPPTLGTGGGAGAFGRFTLYNGNWCNFRGTIFFGTSGATTGSGQYVIPLPVGTTQNGITVGVPHLGTAVLYDSSTTTFTLGTCYAAGGVSTFSIFVPSGAKVGAGTPWAWGASDYISFSFTYEIA